MMYNFIFLSAVDKALVDPTNTGQTRMTIRPIDNVAGADEMTDLLSALGWSSFAGTYAIVNPRGMRADQDYSKYWSLFDSNTIFDVDVDSLFLPPVDD